MLHYFILLCSLLKSFEVTRTSQTPQIISWILMSGPLMLGTTAVIHNKAEYKPLQDITSYQLDPWSVAFIFGDQPAGRENSC